MKQAVRRLGLLALSTAIFLVPGSHAHAASGGGLPGLTPTPPPNPPNALRLPVQGALPGQPNGTLSLVFRLWEGSASPNLPALHVALFEETAAVSVQSERFTHSLGKTVWAGVPSSVVAGNKYLYVTWSLPATPDTAIGGQSFLAAAYALTLSPGATVEASSAQPALTVSNTGKAVSAEASGSTGRGVVGAATSTYGVAYGVEGRAASPSGAGGLFVNTAGGDLILGRNDDAAAPAFRVANTGQVFVNGIEVGQVGPKGDKGDKGDKGNQGEKGNTGATGPAGASGPSGVSSFCVQKEDTSCAGVCMNGSVLLAQAKSPCYTSHGCAYAGVDGICCVCSNTSN